MLNDLRLRFRSAFKRSAVEDDLNDELRFHFDQQVAKLVASGIPVADARRRAHLALGTHDEIREQFRDASGIRFLETLLQDFRYGIRMLLKNWRTASIAAFSLAVAMALSVAALSVFNGVMLRPPVATAPEQLVSIFATSPGEEAHVSYPDYKYYRDHNHSFSGVAAFPEEISQGPMTVGGLQETGTIESASDNYFEVMGIRPLLGQFFAPGDDEKKTPEAILTYSGWKRWGADPGIVGKTVVFRRGRTLTIVGVAPKNFTGVVFGFSADVITTLAGNSRTFTDRNNRWLCLTARLSPGITRQHARAEMQALLGQLAAAYPKADKDRSAVVTPATVLSEDPDARSTAELISAVLIAIVLMVLLIACANVANLLLGLATGRKQEMLIRAALGASRRRLMRQLLTESATLCTLGGIAGFLIASATLARFWQFSAFMSYMGSFNFSANFRTNSTVLLMTIALIFIASLATGLTPAIYASATDVAGALSGEAVIGGRRKSYVRHALVVIQVAVCTLVMVGVGLCMRSLQNLKDVNLGFSTRNLAAIMIDLRSNRLSEAQGLNSYNQLKQAALQLGGVQSSSLALELPLVDSDWSTDGIRVEGSSAAQWTQIPVNIVDGDYFSTLGIPLLRGRTFDSSDTKNAPEVVVINHNMAETYWPGADPIGKQLHIQNGTRVVTVAGVVGDSKYNTLDEKVHPVIYYALGQHYLPQLLLTVRTRGNASLRLRPLSETVEHVGLQVDSPPFTLHDVMYFSLLLPILTLRVVTALGALALMLAILGLYGAVFYSVNERKREIGIRVALGAQPFHLLKLFLQQTAIISGIGVSAGLFLGIAATILFRSQFYRISPVEWQVLIPVAVAMVLISMAIAYAAARRWIKVSPMEAVRHT
jgi:predicted permease